MKNDKLCFALMNESGQDKLIAALERDGRGSYIGCPLETFEHADTARKVDLINDMIVALVNADEVKRDINFSEYQRQ